MPSRGVVFGDFHRANKEWNARIEAAGEGAGVDVDHAAFPQNMPRDVVMMLLADLFDPVETRMVLADLVESYTGTTTGTIFEIYMSMCAHAAALGVMTERPRWDAPEPGSEPFARAARLVAGLLELVHMLEKHEGDPGACEYCERLMKGIGDGPV